VRKTGIHILKMRLGKNLGKIVEKTASPLFSWLVVPWGATISNKTDICVLKAIGDAIRMWIMKRDLLLVLMQTFPPRVRFKCQSVGYTSHWITLSGFAAGLLATVMLLQFFLVLTVYPETKSSTLEAIQASFGIH
jgi:hypothetical protein